MINPYKIITGKTDFHKKRSYSIGSSDIPVLLGLIAQKTPYQLWKEKTGREFNKFEDNAATVLGHITEGIILSREIEHIAGTDIAHKFRADYYKHEQSRPANWQAATPFMPFLFFSHPEDSRLSACPDCVAIKNSAEYLSDDLIIEAKLGSRFANIGANLKDAYNIEDDTENGLPLRVYLQCQWQSLVCGIEKITVRALIDSITELRYVFKSNHKHQGELREVANRFLWHIEKDKMPPPVNQDDIFDIYDKVRNEVLIVGDKQAEEAEKYYLEKNKWRRIAAEASVKIKEAKNALAVMMGDYKYLESTKGKKLAQQVMTKPIYPNISPDKIKKYDLNIFNRLKENDIIPEPKERRYIL